MKITVEIDLIKEDAWKGNGSYPYRVPRFGDFTVDVIMPAYVLTQIQELLQDAANSDTEATWVVNSLETFDKGPAEG